MTCPSPAIPENTRVRSAAFVLDNLLIDFCDVSGGEALTYVRNPSFQKLSNDSSPYTYKQGSVINVEVSFSRGAEWPPPVPEIDCVVVTAPSCVWGFGEWVPIDWGLSLACCSELYCGWHWHSGGWHGGSVEGGRVAQWGGWHCGGWQGGSVEGGTMVQWGGWYSGEGGTVVQWGGWHHGTVGRVAPWYSGEGGTVVQWGGWHRGTVGRVALWYSGEGGTVGRVVQWEGGTVVQWGGWHSGGWYGCTLVSTAASQRQGPGFNSRLGHCLCGVCTFSPCLRGFPPVFSLCVTRTGTGVWRLVDFHSNFIAV